MARLDARGLTDPIRAWIAAGPAVPRHLPRPPAPVRGQRRGRRDDARRPARADGPARGRPDAAAHRLEPGRARRDRTRSSTASPTAPTSTSSTRTPGAPAAAARRRRPRRRPTTARRSCRPSRAARCSASSSTRSGAAATACGCWPTSSTCVAGRLMLRRRVIPCLDVADGRVVKGTRFVDLVDEGDPPELAERYAARGRRRARLPRHHAPRPSGAARCSTSSSGRPAGRSSR